MSGFSVQVDDSQIIAELSRLSKQCNNLRPIMQAIGQVLMTSSDLAFRESRNPWGKAWKDLSEVTLLQRGKRAARGKGMITKQGHTRASSLRAMLTAKPLRDTGRLAASISAQVSKDSVTVGTNVIYAAVQQFGAKQGAFGRTKHNAPIPWGDIPARPFLPIRNGKVDLPNDTKESILSIISRHLSAS